MKLALIGQVVSEKKMFENNGPIHVYSPRARADNPWGSNCFFFQKCNSYVNLVICCKIIIWKTQGVLQ